MKVKVNVHAEVTRSVVLVEIELTRLLAQQWFR